MGANDERAAYNVNPTNIESKHTERQDSPHSFRLQRCEGLGLYYEYRMNVCVCVWGGLVQSKFMEYPEKTQAGKLHTETP